MRRLLILLAATAVLVSACGTDGNAVNVVASPNGTASGIHVTGEGRVTGTPDTMSITLGVSVVRPTMDAATAEAAALAEAVIAAVKANGVADADIQTANYAVYPEYDWNNNTQRLIGYRVTNELRIKVRDIPNAGDVLDAATGAGGDDVVVSGLTFSIEDNAELLTAARAAAWADAEAKATQLAELSGLSLGSALAITETINYSSPPVYYERAGGDADGTPIQPGTSDVTVTIQVSFSIG